MFFILFFLPICYYLLSFQDSFKQEFPALFHCVCVCVCVQRDEGAAGRGGKERTFLSLDSFQPL